MERIHIKGNTHCLKGRHLLPYYQVSENECILLDVGHRQDREKLEEALEALGLRPVGIILTHMHYDHHENTRYFREKYGIPVAMPRMEAEICRSTLALKNHLFCFPMGLIEKTERLQNLICPVDRPIEWEEESIDLAGVIFRIVHSPGHSPDHICIITPDKVCCVGDALLSGEDLESAEIPFIFDMSAEFKTKELLRTLTCDVYLVSHMGIYEDIQDLIAKNLTVIKRQLAQMRDMVKEPMTFCDCYEGIRKALGHTKKPMHPVMNLHLERYMRPYLEYLIDAGELQLIGGKGAPTVAPMGLRSMSERGTVLLGLSGGVDSAVSATLLKQAGYEVHGHFLDIGLGGEHDARMVAERLGIPFSTGSIREELEQHVCKPFTLDYLAGRTPIPCARCNPYVKFPALFRAAEACKADFVATGHYARIVRDESGEAFLHRGQHTNDQSYMLARLPKAWLSRIFFPLGDYEKSKVRELARGFGIPVADKPDSMEICFIPDGDYAAWLEQRGETPPPGNFVTAEGKVLGTHKGIHHYTLGQRRGLGISAEHRLFVSELRPETNEVVLSDGGDLFSGEVFCRDLNLLAPIADGQSFGLRIRHSKTEYAATIRLTEHGAALTLQKEARAPTPGQLAVFYDGERVLGSGWISDEI